MSKRQTRRSISVTGRTYAAMRAHCDDAGTSMSDLVEQLVASHFGALGLSASKLAQRAGETGIIGSGIHRGQRPTAAPLPAAEPSAAAQAIAKKRKPPRATAGTEPGPAPSPELRFAAVSPRRVAAPTPPPLSDVSIMPGRDGVSTRAPRPAEPAVARAGGPVLW